MTTNYNNRRQIFDDILFMESSEGWSIELERIRDGKKVYYRYADTSFSINNLPLNEMEITQLQSAIEILQQFKGLPQFEWINEMVPKLRHGIQSHKQTESIISFDNNSYLKGIEFLGPLYNAIFNKRVLEIKYQPFDSPQVLLVTLHPSYLKQYNNRWFLMGYNPDNGKPDWNLALDRMVEILETNEKYNTISNITWEEYFEDLVGVTKSEGAVVDDIIMVFYGKTGKYIETKPLHGSQRSKWLNENELEVKLKLIVNYEFIKLLLSYAESVKVISPESLVNELKQRLQTALSRYT